MRTTALPATLPAHILIAEDSTLQAYMLRRVLQEQGYQVSVASNGQTALEMITQIRPTLIISDVNMPLLSGYELCRQVKANPALGAIPVILVTTMSDPDEVLLGLKCGADSFVVKPYDKSHLMERVQHAISSTPLRVETEDSPAVSIVFRGERHQITAGREQILNLLMSTYDASVQRNKELHESRQQLTERTAEALAANRFLDSIIENIPDMIFIKDAADLKYVRVNRAAEKLLGIPREHILGENAFALFPKSEAEFFVSVDRKVLASGVPEEIAEEPLTAAGKIHLIHTKKVAVLDERGVPTHTLGISEDITQKKEMEKEIFSLNAALRAHAEDLEASNKSLESFASAASHDLRSPLSVISGYAAILEKKYLSQLDETGQRYLGIIGTTTKRMAQLIDDLLAFSKLGRLEICKTGMDMHGLAQQVIAEMLPLHLDDKKPDIELGWLPPVPGDAALLRQVWTNLLSNAVKYSSRATSPRIEISGDIIGLEAVYSVRDNGAGFSMDHYDKLFEIFQRLHADDEFEGTGVGLPIVHRIVTKHGGRVWAEGKVDQGAVFHFALPV
jgi:PAS domain S-box-containing protein